MNECHYSHCFGKVETVDVEYTDEGAIFVMACEAHNPEKKMLDEVKETYRLARVVKPEPEPVSANTITRRVNPETVERIDFVNYGPASRLVLAFDKNRSEPTVLVILEPGQELVIRY